MWVQVWAYPGLFCLQLPTRALALSPYVLLPGEQPLLMYLKWRPRSELQKKTIKTYVNRRPRSGLQAE